MESFPKDRGLPFKWKSTRGRIRVESPMVMERISAFLFTLFSNMGMGQIPIDTFLVGWTSIYQLFWCSPGVQGFDPLPYHWIIDDFCCSLTWCGVKMINIQLIWCHISPWLNESNPNWKIMMENMGKLVILVFIHYKLEFIMINQL